MQREGENNVEKVTGTKVILSSAILIGWVLIFFLFKPVTYLHSSIRFVLLYVLSLLLLNTFKSNKIARALLKILWIPGILIITFYPFLLAVLSVVFSFGIVYLITVIIFEVLPVDLFHYHFTKALNIYLEISISALVVAYFYDKVLSIWDYVFIRRDEHKKLSYKIMNQSRAKFSIYFLYFTALLILNITRLNGQPVFPYILEKAILESFGTFLAFERIISNWKMFMEEKSMQ